MRPVTRVRSFVSVCQRKAACQQLSRDYFVCRRHAFPTVCATLPGALARCLRFSRRDGVAAKTGAARARVPEALALSWGKEESCDGRGFRPKPRGRALVARRG